MLGQHAEAVADADFARKQRVDSVEMSHNVACIYAQAAVKVANDESRVERGVMASQYRDCAIDSVRQTLEMLPANERLSFWTGKILSDSALTPIRNEPRFRQLEKLYVRP
jgi:hypothetical protein